MLGERANAETLPCARANSREGAIIAAERFAGPVMQIPSVHLERVEAGRVHLGEIPGGLALHDPFRQRAAGAG